MLKQRMNQKNGWVRFGLFSGLFGLALIMLSGCVSSGKYEDLVKEHEVVLAEKAQMEEEKDNLAAEQNRLVEEQARLAGETLREVYGPLRD